MKKSIYLICGTILFSASAIPKPLASPCGQISCEDVYGKESIEVVENLLKSFGTDCKSVQEVHLLDKSNPETMMIYSIKCDDGNGVQDYQIIHWPPEREFNVQKFSGDWMDSINIKY